MSAYEVSIHHIGALVDLGRQLGVDHVVGADGQRNIDLTNEADRAFVAEELAHQNRVSLAWRYRLPLADHRPNPRWRIVHAPEHTTLPALAQALQWLSCYCYQSCEDPGWPLSVAFHYCEVLRDALDHRIVACFPTSWDYDGPPLVEEPAPRRSCAR